MICLKIFCMKFNVNLRDINLALCKAQYSPNCGAGRVGFINCLWMLNMIVKMERIWTCEEFGRQGSSYSDCNLGRTWGQSTSAYLWIFKAHVRERRWFYMSFWNGQHLVTYLGVSSVGSKKQVLPNGLNCYSHCSCFKPTWRWQEPEALSEEETDNLVASVRNSLSFIKSISQIETSIGRFLSYVKFFPLKVNYKMKVSYSQLLLVDIFMCIELDSQKMWCFSLKQRQ